MKKKIIISAIAVLIFTATFSVKIILAENVFLENFVIGNVEALTPEEELPPEVTVQCLSDDKATCVVGKFVYPHTYYNPH